MKNLIIALSLFFALGANAQAKKAKASVAPAKTITAPVATAPKLSNEEAAKKNIQDLTAFVTLTPEKQASLTELFKTKQRMMTEAGTAERKQIVSEIISRKLEATLDGDTFTKVNSNTALYQSLIK